MAEKLTKAQRDVLSFYNDTGPTTYSRGRISTWKSLVRRGLLERSHGLGVIETSITPAGRAVLSGE